MTIATAAPHHIERQRAIGDVIGAAWDASAIHVTGPFCPIDVLFVRAGAVFRVGEVKTRTDSLAILRKRGSYLVTFDKLVKAREVARRLGADLVLVVALVDAVVWWLIADAAGMWQSHMVVRRTVTPANCHGGDAERANAFLSLTDMHIAIEAY